jgi:hypothetical protein
MHQPKLVKRTSPLKMYLAYRTLRARNFQVLPVGNLRLIDAMDLLPSNVIGRPVVVYGHNVNDARANVRTQNICV